MSASERNRFNNIHLSSYFISAVAQTDRSARTVTDPAKTIYPRPQLDSRPQLNVGSASCGASPPQLERARLLNAVLRARLSDVAPPWQARAKRPAAGLSSISMPGVPKSDHDGRNAPRFDETDGSFADATKLAETSLSSSTIVRLFVTVWLIACRLLILAIRFSRSPLWRIG